MSDWKEYKLDELVEITSSKRIMRSEYQEDGIPFFRSKEIIELNSGNEITTELFISKERFLEIKKKFGTPSYGDILLTSVGTLGVPYFVNYKEEFYFKDGNLT
ncbi:TPA: restriction endonuclease subunit S, partial [Haemophilus influenzae]